MFKKKEKNTKTVVEQKNVETLAPHMMEQTVMSPNNKPKKKNRFAANMANDYSQRTVVPPKPRKVVSERHVESMIETVISEPNKKRKRLDPPQMSQPNIPNCDIEATHVSAPNRKHKRLEPPQATPNVSDHNIEVTQVSTPKIMQQNTDQESMLKKRVEALEIETNFLRQELSKIKAMLNIQ